MAYYAKDRYQNPNCFRCAGKGWEHLSKIEHKKGTETKCFHCSKCKACSGSKVLEGSWIRCTKCNGKGHVHTSKQEHKPYMVKGRPPASYRCFFCSNCPACDGKGAIEKRESRHQGAIPSQTAQSPHGGYGQPSHAPHEQQPQRTYGAPLQGAYGDRGYNKSPVFGVSHHGEAQREVLQPGGKDQPAHVQNAPSSAGGTSFCHRCKGQGWEHLSKVGGNKDHRSKCFHCSKCKACGGDGKLDGPHMQCTTCRGKGFKHTSSIRHSPYLQAEPAHDYRCFHCSDCKACEGVGSVKVQGQDVAAPEPGTLLGAPVERASGPPRNHGQGFPVGFSGQTVAAPTEDMPAMGSASGFGEANSRATAIQGQAMNMLGGLMGGMGLGMGMGGTGPGPMHTSFTETHTTSVTSTHEESSSFGSFGQGFGGGW